MPNTIECDDLSSQIDNLREQLIGRRRAQYVAEQTAGGVSIKKKVGSRGPLTKIDPEGEPSRIMQTIVGMDREIDELTTRRAALLARFRILREHHLNGTPLPAGWAPL